MGPIDPVSEMVVAGIDLGWLPVALGRHPSGLRPTENVIRKCRIPGAKADGRTGGPDRTLRGRRHPGATGPVLFLVGSYIKLCPKQSNIISKCGLEISLS